MQKPERGLNSWNDHSTLQWHKEDIEKVIRLSLEEGGCWPAIELLSPYLAVQVTCSTEISASFLHQCIKPKVPLQVSGGWADDITWLAADARCVKLFWHPEAASQRWQAINHIKVLSYKWITDTFHPKPFYVFFYIFAKRCLGRNRGNSFLSLIFQNRCLHSYTISGIIAGAWPLLMIWHILRREEFKMYLCIWWVWQRCDSNRQIGPTLGNNLPESNLQKCTNNK